MPRRLLISLLILPLLLVGPVTLLAATADESLSMVIFPRRNMALTEKMFHPLAEYLSQQLGRQVELVTFRDYPDFWNAMQRQRFDIVHFNQYHYLRSHRQWGYQVFAMNEEGGRSRISGALFVHDDSHIDSVKQLKGKRVLFGGSSTAFIAYIANRHLLMQQGLTMDDYQADFAINPPNALLALYYRQADAAAAGDAGIKMPMVQEQIQTERLRILAKTTPYPHLPWAVSGELEDELGEQISHAMLELNTSETGREILKQAGLSGLVAADDGTYDEVRKVVEEVLGEKY